MPHIVVDDDQARLILESTGAIEIRDRTGKHLGFVARSLLTDEDVAIARERMTTDEPRYTTPEVLEYIHSLER